MSLAIKSVQRVRQFCFNTRLACGIGLLLLETNANAHLFFISTTLDTTNTESLRGAVIAASATDEKNTIVLPQNAFPLSIYSPGAEPGYSAGLVVTRGNLVIRGNPEAAITASGLVGWGYADNCVIHILPGARVRLENLILTGGTGFGGGIDNEGTLELVDCVVTGNTSFAYAGGGGIRNSGTLTMTGCIVSTNSTGINYSGNGGGIYNSGDLQIRRSLIYGNTTRNAPDGGFDDGWGIIIIWGPQAPLPGWPGESAGDGGAIYNSGALSIVDCAIFRNTCGSGGNGTDGFNAVGGDGGDGGNGGGIYTAGTMVIERCKIQNNSCGSGGNGGNGTGFPQGGTGGKGGSGGGIFNAGLALQALLIRTEVTLNSAGEGGRSGNDGALGAFGSGEEIFGPVTIQKHEPPPGRGLEQP